MSKDGPMRLSLHGALDASSVEAIGFTLDRVIARHPAWMEIDLSRLRMIDSVGVGVLVGFCKRLRASGCRLMVVGLRDQPRAVFRLLGLDRALCDASSDSAWN